NGKAFLSKNVKALLERLNIDYKAMPAYSGWSKPYVENKFKDLQNSLTANLVGYIGANIKERQAIEFFYSKKERRLKKGYKTNQRRLKTLEYMRECIDDYSAYFMNNKWLDRL
ncbi:integrase, partial [Campylobacter jejuni]|nr:integrase [Campylobacter jejuni]